MKLKKTKKPEVQAYELTQQDIDIISLALKTRINYLEGLILMEDCLEKDDEHRAYLNVLLRETKRVQRITTYEGQPLFLKLS